MQRPKIAWKSRSDRQPRPEMSIKKRKGAQRCRPRKPLLAQRDQQLWAAIMGCLVQRVDDSDSIVSQGAGYRAESVADGGACNTPPRLRLSASPSSNLGPTQTPISQPGSDSGGVCLEHRKHVTEHAGKKTAGCPPLPFSSLILDHFLFLRKASQIEKSRSSKSPHLEFFRQRASYTWRSVSNRGSRDPMRRNLVKYNFSAYEYFGVG